MGREWNEVPDETEEIVLEDTQEYRVAGLDDEPGEGPPTDQEPNELPEAEADDESNETGEYEQESEYEDDEYEDSEYESDEDDAADADADDVEEHYDDDEYFDGQENEDPEPAEDPEPFPVIGKPYEPVAARVRAIWAALVAQARGVELPGLPDKPAVDLKLVVTIAAILLASLAVGIGAYSIGKGSGDDVDVARLEGEAAGRGAGAIEGASRGYAAGFVKGRDEGFRKTYEEAYRLNFKRAFEQAGLDVPPDKDIDVPEP